MATNCLLVIYLDGMGSSAVICHYWPLQQFFCLSWKLQIYYWQYRILPLDPLCSHFNPFHVLTTHFSKIHFSHVYISLLNVLDP